jgi:hypothetical protein
MEIRKRKGTLKVFVWFMVLMLMICQSIVGDIGVVNAIASPTFTISPAYVSLSSLPTTVVVTSNLSNTFTPGSCYPTLIKSGGATQALSIVNSTSTGVSFTVPSGLTNGTYSIRIGDPKGNQTSGVSKYYDAGNFVVSDPTITTSTPYSNLPTGYDSRQQITIAGQYTHFSMGQTTVEVLSGITVIQTASVVSVTAGSSNTQSLVFKINTGLSTNESTGYSIRITTGSEIITKTGAIKVRGTPTILTDTNTLSAGYTLTTINVTGQHTGFDETTTVNIVSGNGDSTGKVGTYSAASATSLSFTVNTGLDAGIYTIKVKTGVEEETAALTIAQPAMLVKYASNDALFSTIGKYYADTNVKLVGTNTHFTTSTQLFAFNGSTDITAQAISGTPQIAGQVISITLKSWASVVGTSLKLRAVTGNEQAEMTLSVVDPTIALTLNTPVKSGIAIANGYKTFNISITGTYTHFRGTPIVKVKDDLGADTGMAANLSFGGVETALSFDLTNGLNLGQTSSKTYTVEIDMDGDTGTANDKVTTTFIIAAASSISSLSPNPVLNTSSTALKVTVPGINTHFTAATLKPSVEIVGTSATIQNINVINDTTLTFDIIPNSITISDSYVVRVTTEGSAITEVAQTPTDKKLQVSNQGIVVSPATISRLDRGNKLITLTAENLSFDSGAVLLLINGQTTSFNKVNSTTLTFTVPANLSAGTFPIQVSIGGTPYNCNIILLDPSLASYSIPYKIYKYSSFAMTLTGNDSIAFNSSALPTITVGGVTATGVSANTALNTLSFTVPADLPVGFPNIILAWSGGEYANNSVTFNGFEIKHEIDSISIYNGSTASDDTMSIYLNSVTIPTLTAITNVINGSGSSDKTDVCIWSSTNTNVATIIGGSLVIVDAGTTDISASYDGRTDIIHLTVIGPNSISITGPSSSVLLGGTLQLTATANYAVGPAQDITASPKCTWLPSDKVVAGLVTGSAEAIVHVSAEFGGVTGTQAITITGLGLVPSSVNTVELGNKEIIVTGIDTGGTFAVTVGGVSATSSVSNSILKFTVPNGLTAGIKTVSVSKNSGTPITSDLEVKASSITPDSMSLQTGYSQFTMKVTGNNVAFDDSTEKPIVKVDNSTIQANTVIVNQNENTILFPFPIGKIANATVEFSWTSGSYSGNSLTTTISISSDPTPMPTSIPAPATPSTLGGGGSALPTSIPNPTPTPTPIPAAVQQAVSTITDSTTAIKNETDPTKAKDQAVALIKDMADDIKALADKGLSTAAVTFALQDAANAAMDKVKTETVTATLTGSNSKVVIDAAEAIKLLAKLDDIASTAKALNSELVSSKADTKVETVLDIRCTVDKGAKVSEAQIPASLLKAASDKKIDKISIDTGIATMSIAPGAITAASGNVSLSAGKVDNKDLSADIKKAVGGNPVFDFNATAGGRKVSSFNSPVEIKVPFTLKAGQDPEKITVFFVNDKGVLENKAGFYDLATKTVLFTTDHFSKYMIKENKVTFSDTKSKFIEVMAAKGVMKADSGNKFSPTSLVTKGELAEVLVNAFKLGDPLDKALKAKFKDVKTKDKYFGAIALTTAAGLMSGNKDGTFKPNDKVSRQDVAIILAKAAKLYKAFILPSEPDKFITFTDKAKIKAEAKASIAFMVKYGVMEAKTKKDFKPADNITRSDLAKIMYLLLNL